MPAIFIAPVASAPSTAFATPVPSGVIVISPFDPSAIVIFPELVPAFVFKIKSPVPCLVIVASALLSPTRTASASRLTFPVHPGTKNRSLRYSGN